MICMHYFVYHTMEDEDELCIVHDSMRYCYVLVSRMVD